MKRALESLNPFCGTRNLWPSANRPAARKILPQLAETGFTSPEGKLTVNLLKNPAKLTNITLTANVDLVLRGLY